VPKPKHLQGAASKPAAGKQEKPADKPAPAKPAAAAAAAAAPAVATAAPAAPAPSGPTADDIPAIFTGVCGALFLRQSRPASNACAGLEAYLHPELPSDQAAKIRRFFRAYDGDVGKAVSARTTHVVASAVSRLLRAQAQAAGTQACRR
jgi:hypothetical protein